MKTYWSLWNVVNQKAFLLKKNKQTHQHPPKPIMKHMWVYIIITFKYKNDVLEFKVLDWNVRYLDTLVPPTTDLFRGFGQFSYSSHAFIL